MPAVSYSRFQAECLEVYDLKAKATRAKMAQLLRELGELGLRSTSDLKPVAIARWIRAHPDRTPATTKSLLGSFSAACTFGVASGYIKASPFAYKTSWVVVPEPSPDRHHSAEEIARLLSTLDAEAAAGEWKPLRLRALAYTVAFTGLRKMEALGLTWPDVDLEGRVIWIRVNPWRRLKTRASGQPVPIPDALAEVLAAWHHANRADVVFPNADGRPWRGGKPGKKPLDQLAAAGRRARVAGVTFQSLRQSWATHAETLWGLSGPTIQRVLRHTTDRTTRQHYRKADLDNLRAAAQVIHFPRAAS